MERKPSQCSNEASYVIIYLCLSTVKLNFFRNGDGDESKIENLNSTQEIKYTT